MRILTHFSSGSNVGNNYDAHKTTGDILS